MGTHQRVHERNIFDMLQLKESISEYIKYGAET